MFPDISIMAKLDEATQLEVKRALSTLYITGVLEAQVQVNMQSVLSGDPDESSEALAARILEHRKSNIWLLTLIEAGKKANKEISK